MNVTFGSRTYIHFGVDTQKNLQLEEDVFMSVVDSSVKYPTFESVKDKKLTDKLFFHYTCDSNKCEFPMKALKESVELKSCGIKETVEAVVTAIDLNPQLFTARQCGGYIFKGAGKSVVLLKNDAVDTKDDTRFGFADLRAIRRKLIIQHELSKFIDSPFSVVGKLSQGILTAAVLYGCFKVLKRR